MGGLVAHAVMDVQNGAAAQPRRNQPTAPSGRQPGPVPMQPRRGSSSMAARVAAH
jgi:hypothetical protein